VITPEEVIDGVNERYGRHPGYRALHAKGHFYKGTFTPTPYASRLTRAAHMQGDPVPVTVRLSNGSGDPRSRDYVPDVRGMATKFHLPDGSQTDISAQTAPNFPVNTPEGFVEAVQANVGGLARAIRIPLFLVRHPSAIAGIRGNLAALNPMPSFANYTYFAIHAYKWVNAEGEERFVRYTWTPHDEAERLSPGEAKKLGSDYLREEMLRRLQRGPARFDLSLQIAEPGDATDDPRASWPEERERVVAGTLELSEPDDAAEADGDVIVFDPMRLTDGIEPSDDPILLYRPSAYSVSVERRSA
jgi:catalase